VPSTTTTDPTPGTSTPSWTDPRTSQKGSGHVRFSHHRHGSDDICAQIDYHFFYNPGPEPEGYSEAPGIARDIGIMLKHTPTSARSEDGPLEEAVAADNDAAMINALATLQHMVCPSAGVSGAT
jgi:hypothetical protein